MSKSFVSQKIQDMPYSGIRKFFDVAQQLQGVVSLGVGEPDFHTPWNIREEAIFRLERGGIIYTSNPGLTELRNEISRYMSARFSVDYDPLKQTIVTVGGSEAIDLVFRAIIEPGDEVLVTEPCFVPYVPCINMAGGVAVSISTKAENQFRLTPEEILSHITPRTKAILMGYPSNPTGAIMPKAELEQIAAVLREHDILVISDEIYAELTYEGEHISIASLPGMYDKTVIVSGFSKAFSMTGWRLGYACGPADVINAMIKIHQYIVMCAPTVAQYAGIEAMRNGMPSVERMRNEYNQRRRVIVEGFRSMGLECFEPLGAFYVFPSIQSTGLSSEEFCTRLLYDQKVAVVPGSAFGASGEGFIRCSYAYSIENIKTALSRIEKFLQSLSNHRS